MKVPKYIYLRFFFNSGCDYDKSKRYSNALYFYKKAFNLKNANAANNLGIMYEYGHGVSLNKYMALNYYKRAEEYVSNIGRDNYNRLKSDMNAQAVYSSSNSNIFLNLLDATTQTMKLISDIKNDGTKSPSSSISNSSSSDISSSSNSSSNDNSSSKPEKKVPSKAFCTEKARLYFQYEKRLLQMKRDPEIHYNNTDRRNIQQDMRRLRNDLISSGCNQNPYKSAMEDWDGTLD